MTATRWRLITFASVILLCLALIVTTQRWRSSEDTVAGLREAVNAQREAIQTNTATLTELCRTNGIVRGLVSEAIDLRTVIVTSGTLPKELAERYRLNLIIYEGFLDQLDQQTACREVIHP